MARTKEEIEAALAAQIGFIRTSCEAYDRGTKSEAARIANAVCVLVLDRGRSTKSILTQLGCLSTTHFIATAWQHPPGAKTLWTPLVRMRISPVPPYGATHIPRLGGGPGIGGPVAKLRPLAFDDWWNEEVIVHPTDYLRNLTRSQLVVSWRDQDGGSHFDPSTTNAAYNAAKSPRNLNFDLYGFDVHVHALTHATVRQIGYELLLSLSSP